LSRNPKYVIKNPDLAFKDIWRHHPELQNWSSSSWWFFVFFPKQETGYGPKQMMFTFASRTGDLIKVNSTWQKGIDSKRNLGKTEEFMTTVVGWINDGKQVHEEIVHQPALATLSYDDQVLEAWVENDGEMHGGRVESLNTHKYAIRGHFKGKKGEAKFEVWNENTTDMDQPMILDIRGPKKGKLGGTQFVAWRRYAFKGEFTGPSGTEHLSGLGYFQRVLMNVPMFPWKWAYLLFEDGSIFSSFIPYFGLQNFRREYKFYNQFIERMVIPLGPRAYFFNNKTGETTFFDTSNIYPIINKHTNPDFNLLCKTKSGDFIKINLKAHAHAQFLLDRRVIKKLWQTKYIYNEYMVQAKGITGKIDGQTFPKSQFGQAWGNMEYTWGMSL
jgi:hypothetical protein